ncbi:SDR family oxidoreductase [Paraburkholderia dipogonis]|uniref:SDR family oxidoreductase n=1 Tax=Paraburkholderia dipogonis TaxID=1211383 RepID=A0ABW9AV04_9BURK
MKLQNKVAFITGGTSGIGMETAKLFQAEGAKVIVTGTNPGRLEAAGKALGDNALVLSVDLRKPAEIERAVEEVRARYGRIDVVFANAGAGTAAPLESVTPEQIDEQFSLNVSGLFFTIQKTVPLIPKGGSIVVTTSFLNAVGTPGLSILSATKAAIRSLVRSLGAELAPRGIRVNAVSPGPIATAFHTKLGLTDAQLTETATAIQAQVPLQRFGEAVEIARTALFLASDDSSFTTGAEIVVDGGLTQF